VVIDVVIWRRAARRYRVSWAARPIAVGRLPRLTPAEDMHEESVC